MQSPKSGSLAGLQRLAGLVLQPGNHLPVGHRAIADARDAESSTVGVSGVPEQGDDVDRRLVDSPETFDQRFIP